MTNQTDSRQSPPEISPDEVAKQIDQQLASLDPMRAGAIRGLYEVRIARTENFKREEVRLRIKYGDGDPRVTALGDKMRFNDELARDLQFEAVRSSIDVTVVGENSFVFQGFVRNCTGEPKPGLTVALYDSQGGWIRAMGYACTDEDGYFRMQGSGFSDPAGAAPALATIRVFDKQTLLVTDAKPLSITPGKSEYRIIIVCDDGTCPPPPGDTDPPPPAPVTVPDVVGKAEDAATADLKKAGFTATSSTLGTESKQVGKVLEQNPKAGAVAARGSEVAIVVGIAAPRLAVPDVVDQTLRDAKTILENAGLVLGKIDPAKAPEQNRVVKQSPAGGAEADRGAAVDLVIEVPVETVKVPVVEKLPFVEAKKAITACGLTVGKIDPADASDQSVVIAQKPPAGTMVKPGSAVDLSIEGGKGQVTVPNLKGLRLAEARTALAAVGLAIRHIFPPIIATEKFIVVSHVPMAGMKVEKGTPVDVIVAPPLPTPQPSKKSAAKESAAKKKRSRPRKKPGSRSSHRP